MEISRIEKIIINLLTPFDALFGENNFSKEIQNKEKDYVRLIKYNEEGGEIPEKVEWRYAISPCGQLQRLSAKIRKYVN